MGLFFYFKTKCQLPHLEIKGKRYIYFHYKIIWTQFVLHFTTNSNYVLSYIEGKKKQIFAKLQACLLHSNQLFNVILNKKAKKHLVR